jgi:prolipoprotein diacylglyceryl transferase
VKDVMLAIPFSIPSPDTGVWHIFGLPLRAYALCIVIGIVLAMVVSTRRWVARGGTADTMEMVVVWAVPFGIVGARIYHVITDYELYFVPGRNPLDALKIWNGGLGIWGAVALGVLGAYLVARRRGVAFPALLDAAAPAIVLAQAIGRLGNWFNQELFGRPTRLPWGLEIDPSYRPGAYIQYETFHPTFLYEMIWNLLVALALVLLDRRFRLGHGKVFALYVMLYCAGRFWIEALRIDTVNEVGGIRLNNYTALLVFLAATVWFVWLVRNRPGREAVVERLPGAVEELDRDGVAEDDIEPARTEDRLSASAEEHSGARPDGPSEPAGAGEGDTRRRPDQP